MAKFTIYFKDKAIKSYIFDSKIIRIGRDSTNDIVIDNLTIAPVHAAVTHNDGIYLLKKLSDEHNLIINKEEVKEAFLEANDVISIGKYSIHFNLSTTDSNSPDEQNPFGLEDTEELQSFKLSQSTATPDANLQVLDGSHIGRILPLKKPLTRFGHSGSGVVIITKRKGGFFISSLEPDTTILVNQAPLGDKTIHLQNDDTILINKISMQFFLEA